METVRSASKCIPEHYTVTLQKGRPLPIGVHIDEKGVNFSVAVPEGQSCHLVLYERHKEEPVQCIDMARGACLGSLRSIYLPGLNWKKYAYCYQVEGELRPDPYCHRVEAAGPFGAQDLTAPRCLIGTDDYDWEDDTLPLIPLHDVVAYSIHPRGFTKHASSKVKGRGTFRGIMEKLDYLRQLGVNQLVLMPAYEFAENFSRSAASLPGAESRVNYWGYGSMACYFAPKASYAHGNDPEKELKDLIKEIHKRNMELVMEFYFSDDTNPSLAEECLRYWAEKYHVDGFWLSGYVASTTALAMDPVLAGRKLYAPGFDMERIGVNSALAITGGDFSQTARRILKGDEDQLGGFMYHMTHVPGTCGRINYITAHDGFTMADLVSYDRKHNEANGENNRDGSDYNFSWNCGAEGRTRKKKVMELRRRQLRNSMAMLFLAAGTPMLLAGDEAGNSQEGNNNAYCQDNPMAWVQWNNASYKGLAEFVRQLIAFRREHPVLHPRYKLQMTDLTGCGFPEFSFHGSRAWYADSNNYNRHIAMMYCGARPAGAKGKAPALTAGGAPVISAGKGREKAIQEKGTGAFDLDMIYVAYNFHWEPHTFALPRLRGSRMWAVKMDTNEEETMVPDEDLAPLPACASGGNWQVSVAPRSVVMLVGIRGE